MSEYVSKAIVKTITAESKVTIKIKDNFYSVTYSESRDIPDIEDVNVAEERKLLFDDVNDIVDAQRNDIIRAFAKK